MDFEDGDGDEAMEVYYGPPTPRSYGWFHHDLKGMHYECHGGCESLRRWEGRGREGGKGGADGGVG